MRKLTHKRAEEAGKNHSTSFEVAKMTVKVREMHSKYHEHSKIIKVCLIKTREFSKCEGAKLQPTSKEISGTRQSPFGVTSGTFSNLQIDKASRCKRQKFVRTLKYI